MIIVTLSGEYVTVESESLWNTGSFTAMTRNAVAYYRTSSATNVGTDKDSDRRQREACEAYARSSGTKIAREFYDAAVSGADPIDARPAFIEMLGYCQEHEIDLILVETASRFARDLGVQITSHDRLQELGIDLVAADSPRAFIDDSPTAVLIRQVLGAVSEFEKAIMVVRLRGARDRKRAENGKCEGRKSWKELDPELIRVSRQLARKPRSGKPRSLRQIASELAGQGFVNSKGKPFAAAQVQRILAK